MTELQLIRNRAHDLRRLVAERKAEGVTELPIELAEDFAFLACALADRANELEIRSRQLADLVRGGVTR
jgi:hypothetical protein